MSGIDAKEALQDAWQCNAEAVLASAIVMHALGERAISVARMKEGMTNDSFLVTTPRGKYIVRLNGIGSGHLISRTQEVRTYALLKGVGISDEVLAIDPTYRGGYKISRYLKGARPCDPRCESDVRLAMQHLRCFHALHLHVSYAFDVFAEILRYEALVREIGGDICSIDYAATKERVLSLQVLLEPLPKEMGLAHIDVVPDNVLFSGGRTYLIDWEYAAQADQHLDLAMFAVYAGYDEKETRRLLALYFDRKPAPYITAKVFAYMAAAGLLWSNWCAFKTSCGETFGHYADLQYEYARRFPILARHILEGVGDA